MASFSEIAKMDVKELGGLISGGLGGGLGSVKLGGKGGGHKATGTLVGLDIQPGYVAAVEAEVNGALKIKRACGAWLPSDVIREGEVIDEGLLSETLKEMFHGGIGKRVRVGLANQRTVVRLMELPPITDRKDIEAAIGFQAQDQIPMPMSQAVMDFHPLGIVDTPAGRRQRVIVVAAQRDMVTRLVSAVTAAGLKPVAVDLSAFALIRALRREGVASGNRAVGRSDQGGELELDGTEELQRGGERSRPPRDLQASDPAGDAEAAGTTSDADQAGRVLYLNIGGLTNLAIAQDRICHFTRTVGSGLESIASSLAERHSVPLVQAREALAATDVGARPSGASDPGHSDSDHVGSDRTDDLGRTNGSDRTDDLGRTNGSDRTDGSDSRDAELRDDARTMVRSGIAEIAREVRNSIDFHRAQEGGGEVQTVVVSGPALEIEGFEGALQSALGRAVQRRTVTQGLGEVQGVPAERLTLAAGLAIEEAL